ncbi:peptidase S1 [Ketogulonicigenium vulgare]|uniref:Peptidase S1 and S6, chymotrypsin/Hap n=1 Tax=Ketogulonicigenium vulgare (strain WSH-001) TaxID=759362 RepID=F9Y4Z9_KETVW|nr:peptidase S1 [Ketogulonicigenium vulgare]ADO42431.1 peptidase S1 and S6, chymotrypsin/Hap [Ketogulonicigenium vulgare Y25]AEM40631.1 Peptidase S1 and S6, chymotrypsin/Hap [Ketogulonicigenium vulgare WSH-001]ALJ82298.1 peptidase S1 [Ketogulonicigenium vulgare]ANW34996.1 peptidase S1 [Ketogulonicigenium vulgare]AOZ54345.1 peptidase S1 and S6, chymotrypsin/Hap [Ketogulonicigenium vulgare]
MIRSRALFGAVTAALVGLATAASACPDWRGQPHFGSIQLNAGFMPDPHVRNITAGGTINLQNCGTNWGGFVTQRPDFDLYWNGSSAQLTIAIEANADAILLISAPDGTWYYNDDYRGLNPAITFSNPQQGLYDIWIGTYDGSRRNPGRLIITEYNW